MDASSQGFISVLLCLILIALVCIASLIIKNNRIQQDGNEQKEKLLNRVVSREDELKDRIAKIERLLKLD